MLREYFLLTDATATAKRIPEGVRKSLERQLRVARQRAEAADALWSNGHNAEGLRLAADAFRSTLGVASDFSAALGLGASVSVPSTPVASKSVPLKPLAADAPIEHVADEDMAPEATEAEAETSDAEANEAEANEAASEADPNEAASEADANEALEPAWRAALKERGLAETRLAEVVAAEAGLAAKALPGLDDDVSAVEGTLFQKLVASRVAVDHVLAPATLTPGALLKTRLTRIGMGVLFLAALITGATVALWPTRGEFTQASGRYSTEFTAANVIDGDTSTEWLLPDGANGWVEVEMLPPRSIHQVRLRNAHNRHYNNRGTREYRIQFYGDGVLAETVEGEWPTLEPDPEWTEHEVELEGIDRIRVQVVSHHELGGGLAELSWE
ncbi:MAG: discoidin domain-containing protein [Sandaracinaceae bacterium]